LVASGLIRVDYFATDLYRLFYINVEMPPGTKVDKTLETLEQIEARVRERLRPEDAHAVISFAGQRFTEQEPIFGEEKGQVFVSLNPAEAGMRSVDALIEEIREASRHGSGSDRGLFPAPQARTADPEADQRQGARQRHRGDPARSG
jgi:multidrug efflux pump subunit AcrB